MKNILSFLLYMSLICSYSFGQLGTPVYDAKADINHARNYILSIKDFAEAAEQTLQLKKTYDFFVKAEELINKISRPINDLIAIDKIISSQVEAAKLYSFYSSESKKFKYISKNRIDFFTYNLLLFNSNVRDLMKLSKLILSPDYFKMTDAERMDFLNSIESQMSKEKVLMKIKYSKIKAENFELSIKNN